MEKVTVYRVAIDCLADGPFTAGYLEDVTDMYQDAKNFPCVWNDDALKEFMMSRAHTFKNTACACIDIPQLHHWFNYSDIIWHLSRLNAQVYIMSLPSDAIVKGRMQVLCDLSQAVVLDTIPIEQLPMMDKYHG